ncbi:MAG: adenylyl-sulfate kinase [Desulfosalsimonadaceae bacterium]|nr:adenylyl-sulfate kinase [Desulfosalsimonadaceae bacterium]
MDIQKATNIHWHQSQIVRSDRERLNGHRGITLWFTGLPASGKSTLAVAVEQEMHRRNCRTYILDGDNIRHGLNKDLGFSPEDRNENIRRIGEVANLLRDAGMINMVAFISPYRSDRQLARDLSRNDGTFIEVFVDCPVSVCEARDPKGMYQKARQGILKEFTGISAPYEAPESPEIHLHTDQYDLNDCVAQLMDYLGENQLIC